MAQDLQQQYDSYGQPVSQAPTQARTPQTPAGPTLDPNSVSAVNGYYTKYLGRAAAPTDAQTWLTGGYGGDTSLSGIEGQIKSSGEAQAYAAKNAPAATDVAGTVNSWMQSNNPQGHQDANYWIQRINETGGLNAGNIDYWKGRFLEAPGTHVEGATGGTPAPAPAYAPSGAPGTTSDPNLAALVQLMQQQQAETARQKAADQAKADALYGTLSTRANQSLEVNPNDPIIKGQTDAFNAAQTRQQRTYLQGLAESAGPIANLGAETRLSSERVGQNDAGFQATLLSNELTQRRSEIQSALSSMGSMLSAQQQNDLSAQLKQIDAAIAQQGQAGQLGLGYSTLAGTTAYQQGTLANQSQSLANQLRTFYAGQDNSNAQFNTTNDINAATQAWIRSRIEQGLPIS